MIKNRVKEFVVEHKMQIALATGFVTGIAIWAITRDKDSNYINIAKPDLTTGTWANLSLGVKGKYAGGVFGCSKGVDLADLGKFGDALATIDGIGPNEPMRIIFGTERSFK